MHTSAPVRTSTAPVAPDYKTTDFNETASNTPKTETITIDALRTQKEVAQYSHIYTRKMLELQDYPTIDDDENGERLYDLEYMKLNYGHYPTWDPIVCCVTGILRESKGAGNRNTVYVRLNNDRCQHRLVCMPLKVARARLPLKLITFYERHLQWLVNPDGESHGD
ncbi:hypothetical protein AAF712_014792 [Marasmius tenuissimus]|uniref:Chromo shadow domain-containing protein n=1 Tax=Marasmius tenuissimus TaxID=585030 RepID=A0ABR2ZCL8_9AGAR